MTIEREQPKHGPGGRAMSNECCGTCKYNRYGGEVADFECVCKESEAYGLQTAYDDFCEEWEKKDE